MPSQTNRVPLVAAIIIAILLVVIAVLARTLMLARAPAALAATPTRIAATATAAATVTEAATATDVPTETPVPPTVTPIPSPTPTPTPLPMPSWSEASKLTSLEYINTVVIERERPKEGLDQVIPGRDRVVMMVVGKIHAGVDLSKIPVSKIEIKGKSIKLILPHAAILAVELLPEESRIYESDRNWVFSNYEGIEKEALEEARRKLQENNENNQKMLQMAETMARLQLTELLHNLGYDDVVIEFEE